MQDNTAKSIPVPIARSLGRDILDQQAQIGREPPLTLTENSRAALKSGGVSFRWLTGAFVTGICGAALIGGALVTSVDGAFHFARPLTSWSVIQAPGFSMGLGDRNSSTAKSDKLVPAREAEISRKVIQTTAERRVGEKAFISIRPYELVTISLALTNTDVSKDLPAFDPLKIFADGGVFSAPRDEPLPQRTVENEGTIAVELTTFDDVRDIQFDPSDTLQPEEIAAVVREAVPFDETTQVAFQAPSVPQSVTQGVAFATFAGVDSTRRLMPLAAPANETVIAKSPADPALEDADTVSVATVAKGDTLNSILNGAGIAAAEARVIAETLRPVFQPENLQPGHQIQLATKDGEDGAMKLVRLSLFEDGAHIGSIRQASGAEHYVALDSAAEIVRPVIKAAARPKGGKRASIYTGLYEAGIRNDIPRGILNRLVRVHSYDVDFQRGVQAGDNFTAFFELPDDTGAPPDPAPLYISMTVRGEGRGFYKFRTSDDGVVDYYDVDGRSAKKFLIRKPMNGGRFRSGFGMRRHPILRYRRMHKGVDWSAPRGTPIVAAGNGTVIEAKWKSGYGNWVKIRHANGYETNYAHMTRHARGIASGGRVRQGQVIGYVGSTGLSTGPHLHYEVEVNGRHVDPLRIRLPRGRVLQGAMLETFHKEKGRIDALMAKPPAQSTLASRETVGKGPQIAKR